MNPYIHYEIMQPILDDNALGHSQSTTYLCLAKKHARHNYQNVVSKDDTTIESIKKMFFEHDIFKYKSYVWRIT